MNTANPSNHARSAIHCWWCGWYETKKPLLVYGSRFLGVISLLYAFSLLPLYQDFLAGATVVYAGIAHGLIQALGGDGSRDGATLRSGADAILTVKPFCTAFDYSWFLIAAIVAFPARFGQKLLGLAIGVPLLLVLNVLRISSLYWTGITFPWHFGFMHEQFWAVLLNFSTICCAVFWMMWIKRTNRHEN